MVKRETRYFEVYRYKPVLMEVLMSSHLLEVSNVENESRFTDQSLYFLLRCAKLTLFVNISTI